ncbi:hypothetical protein [Streptomyces sp. NPDC008121]|uniref:hypothetical protein n=1 Tax=Streptomyces sp. NPDC008121 TaxID=3364809 RepID=UPI0036EDA325
MPHAKGFAAGVVLAGILAVANFTHAQVYQPYTATAMLTTSVDFGPATALTPDGAVSVPVRLRTRNTGKVGVYVLGSLYQVSGREHSYVDKPRPDTDWLQDLNSRQRDLMRYTDVIPGRYELLSQGQFIGRSGPAAMVLDPGADVVTERVVQFPKEKSYEVLAATANIVFLRKDRAKLLDDYAASGASSWTKEFRHGSTSKAPEWVTHSAPVNTFRHQSRIAHSTAVLENTRAPHYVTVWWALHTPTSEIPFAPDLVAVVGTKEDLNHAPTATQRHLMRERYGLAYAPSGSIHRSLPDLLKTP